MRRFIFAAIAASTVAGAGLLAAAPAQAFTLPGAAALAGTENGLAHDVRLVCERTWNGYYWVRRCWQTGPRHFYGPRRFYRPPVRFY